MTSITKPKVQHPSATKNALNLSRRDYEGSMSTLCAGCGHDSVTAALIDAFWQLVNWTDVAQRLAKVRKTDIGL